MTQVFYRGDLDFEEIGRRLRKLKPEKITKQEIVFKLSSEIESALSRGITYKAILEVLKEDYGISLGEATLKKYLDASEKQKEPLSEKTNSTETGSMNSL